MSKKKNRLNKQLIEKRLRELEAETRQGKNTISQKKEIKTTHVKASKGKVEKKDIDESDNLIFKDVKKIGAIALIMLLIFVALFFIKIKTNYIPEASNKLINILHIGQL